MKQRFKQLLVLLASTTASLMLVLFFSFSTLSNGYATPVLYVNKNVVGGTSSGDSWANAIPELADALELTVNDPSITEIWVADGTYQPLYLGNGDYTSIVASTVFNITNLKLYGGFAGYESTRDERNWKNNPTILSATFDNYNNLSLVKSDGAISETVLDGFILENAERGDHTITFSNSNARHIINHCIIRNNESFFGAVGVNNISNMYLANSLVLKNTGYQVGGFMNRPGGLTTQQITIVNTTFIGNVGQNAGAIESYGMLSVANSIFWSNRAQVQTEWTMPDIWADNPTLLTVRSTITQRYTGPDPTANDVTATPILWFTDDQNDDYTLWSASPARNTGNNALYDATILGAHDLNGVERLRDITIDKGAYEVQQGDNPLPLRLVDFSAKNEQNVITLAWQTADEEQTHSFEIQYSDDLASQSWKAVGVVPAKGSGNHAYSFTHIPTAVNVDARFYYRLRMIDQDGSYTFSPIRAVVPLVTENEPIMKGLQVKPNFISSETTVTIESNALTNARLYTTTGQPMMYFTLQQGSNQVVVPALPSGMYILQTDAGQSAKLLVQP